jgi:hypothetical protein
MTGSAHSIRAQPLGFCETSDRPARLMAAQVETWYLRNTPSAGAAEIAPFAFGAPGDKPVTGEDVIAPEPAAFLLVVVGLTGMFIRKKSYPPSHC